MKEIVIYEYQLDAIITALSSASRIMDCSKLKTCHDRDVQSALRYAEDAKKGEIEGAVNRFDPTGKRLT